MIYQIEQRGGYVGGDDGGLRIGVDLIFVWVYLFLLLLMGP